MLSLRKLSIIYVALVPVENVSSFSNNPRSFVIFMFAYFWTIISFIELFGNRVVYHSTYKTFLFQPLCSHNNIFCMLIYITSDQRFFPLKLPPESPNLSTINIGLFSMGSNDSTRLAFLKFLFCF